MLDTKDLRIEAVTGAGEGGRLAPLAFSLGPADPVLGSALSITLPPGVETVHVGYRVGGQADALQWLEGRQTRNGRPFLYTQSGTIHARSWIPLQDSPALRFTWEATVQAPPDLVSVMSGTLVSRHGPTSRFRMARPVPAYLVALAVGDLEFRAWDGRTGVFAERPVVAGAHSEFRDTPRMLEVAESLFGPYRWDRYDLLVMPPAFPYGGVENAQLTFVTPTLLAGDRSLVSTIAHELAHAWAGNLVTQATWNDVWLNEGLTVYLERRIVEALYRGERAMAEAVLFLARLRESLPAPVAAWIEEPGLPVDAPNLSSAALEAAGRSANAWAAAATPAVDLPARSWSPQQWAFFLTRLPRPIDRSRAGALDKAWHLSGSRNPTILVPWLRLGIRFGHAPALARAEEVLRTIGQGRVVMPLYEQLLALPDGPARAARVYCGARSSYHPVIVTALDRQVRCETRPSSSRPDSAATQVRSRHAILPHSN